MTKTKPRKRISAFIFGVIFALAFTVSGQSAGIARAEGEQGRRIAEPLRKPAAVSARAKHEPKPVVSSAAEAIQETVAIAEAESPPAPFSAEIKKAPGEEEIWLLARLINGEGRGESYLGQVAIGAVVMNRLGHPAFPNTISGVIHQPGAFNAVDDGQFCLEPSESCLMAAREAFEGFDPTGGALYYWNPATATSRWIKTLTVSMSIGNHVFAMN